jgi:hypothetical protein
MERQLPKEICWDEELDASYHINANGSFFYNTFRHKMWYGVPFDSGSKKSLLIISQSKILTQGLLSYSFLFDRDFDKITAFVSTTRSCGMNFLI